MDKNKIIEEICKCAKKYNKTLENRNIMFVYLYKDSIQYIETKFTKANFLHLTGIKTNKNLKANSFFDKCLKGRLNVEDIRLRKDGNTIKKLSVLPILMNINKNARIIGDYDTSHVYLYSEKIIGNVVSCLGFIKAENYYVCNTTLKEDIRKISCNQGKIICIASKNIENEKYNEITYINKKYKSKTQENKRGNG